MNTRKITIEYNGAAYHGWQRQPNVITIQEVMEEVLQRITGQKTPIIASGRTDAGVHALAQIASFQHTSTMSDYQLQRAFNALLPTDIVVKQVETVDRSFHARFSAIGKVYRYTILNNSVPSAFDYRFSWFIPKPLNIAHMEKAAGYLVGKHDFTSFRSSTCNARTPVRTLERIDIRQKEQSIELWFEANGFLKQMVRNITGTLVECGRGKTDPLHMEAILSSKDRRMAGPTAPPQGLCLMEVKYGKTVEPGARSQEPEYF